MDIPNSYQFEGRPNVNYQRNRFCLRVLTQNWPNCSQVFCSLSLHFYYLTLPVFLSKQVLSCYRELSVSANDGYWHHICLSWENTAGSLKFYKDGVLSAHRTNFKTGYTIRPGGSLVLGQDQDSLAGSFHSVQSFQGIMANLNVWDYVLCPDIIARISKACLSEELGTVYKWADLKHGVKGKPRVLVPSPCDTLGTFSCSKITRMC